MNLIAGCDHLCQFCWADVKHPGKASDCLSFATSPLGLKLEQPNSNIVKNGHTIIGDNAWVPRLWMTTPIPGHCITVNDDAYNFYHSQVRITIGHTFGIFVHRWGILRRPLSISMLKVPPFMMALIRLHNFCINSKCTATPTMLRLDEHRIRRMAATCCSTSETRRARGTEPATDVRLAQALLWSYWGLDIILLTCLIKGDQSFLPQRMSYQWR